MAKKKIPTVVILGLGRFGMALGEELVHSGVEVLGVDANEDIVTKAATKLTHVAVADTTNVDVLRQLSVHEAPRVVIGIGSDMGASLLTANLVVVDLEVDNVWAKADSLSHAKILHQIGVHHVIRPERDTGRRVAHLISGQVEEYVEFASDYAMVKLAPPTSMIGKTVAECTGNVSIVAVRPSEGSFKTATPDTVVNSGDLIIAAGRVKDLEAFGG